MATIASKLPPVRRGQSIGTVKGTQSTSAAEVSPGRRKSTESPGDDSNRLIGWFDAEIKPKLVSIEVGVHSLSATLSTCLKTVQRIDSIHSQGDAMASVASNYHHHNRLRSSRLHASMPPASRRAHRRLPLEAGEWHEDLTLANDIEALFNSVVSEPRGTRARRDGGEDIPIPGLSRKVSPTSPTSETRRPSMISGDPRINNLLIPDDNATHIHPVSFGSIIKKSPSATSHGSMIGRLRHAQERQGDRSAKVWNFLENPESGVRARRYAMCMPMFVVAAVLLTLYEAVDPRPDMTPLDFLESALLAAVLQTAIDIIFLIELLIRFASCPSRKAFFVSIYNLLDLFAVVPLIPRVAVGFVLPTEGDSSSRGLVRHFLLCVAPLLRLLKVLRHFKTFQLLFLAFKRVFEALPVLLFTQLLITLIFSPLIYFVEPRENIPSLPTAIWLTLVTMTTVGYGDVVPSSLAGSAIVATLVVSSMIFVAFPLGIIGHTFTQVWRDRDRILLMQRTRDCLDHWGYTAKDVHSLFELADRDKDGLLDLDEFRDLMHHMKIGLSDDRIVALFKSFDYDYSGSINDEEFIWTLFPAADLRTPCSSKAVTDELDKSESEGDD